MDQYIFEKRFTDILSHLLNEIVAVRSKIQLLVYIDNNRKDRLDELNIAPAFFGMVLSSLFNDIIISLARIYQTGKEISLQRFINIVEANLDDFTQITKSDRHEILQKIKNDRRKIAEQEGVTKNLLSWRNKHYAHFDKEYFNNPGQLKSDFPLLWSDLDKLTVTAGEILNGYSIAYDRTQHCLDTPNSLDVQKVFDILHLYITAN